MILRDDTSFYSWVSTVSREGEDETNTPLLPFQRSLLLVLLATLQEQPDAFFNDMEEVYPEDVTDIIENLMSRLSS